MDRPEFSDRAAELAPPAPVLVARARGALWLTAEGVCDELGNAQAAARARRSPPLVCHAVATARRLGAERFAAYDILELFAFTLPGRFCAPTPRGVAAALDLARPDTPAREAVSLRGAVAAMLAVLDAMDDAKDAIAIAASMANAGWSWGAMVLTALGQPHVPSVMSGGGMAAWRRLPEWSEYAPEPPSGNIAVRPAEARQRLVELLGPDAESRPQQADYASGVTAAFEPRQAPGSPNLVLAEAGTGTGKTLGYIAPASVWAKRNGAAVWISTYTRNLQRQIDGELDRCYPEAELKAAKAVIRKGRENYLCLLNFEEAVARAGPLTPREVVGLGLVARWLTQTRDGDLGGDFPAWLGDLVGAASTFGLADRRGECLYSACIHYNRCFIERSVRRARRAEIVVANHALVMVQAALGGVDDTHLPTRYVFDEGHHVFDAADSAFAAHLSGLETADLRRWLLGADTARAGRARGLAVRVGDLLGDDRQAQQAFQQVLQAARALPASGWRARLDGEQPHGPTEAFLQLVRAQVFARVRSADGPYGLECDVMPLADGVGPAASALRLAIDRLLAPMAALRKKLLARLEDEADELDTATRHRIDAVCRSLQRRGTVVAGGWRQMLMALEGEDADQRFVDWFGVERIDGREIDVGMYRHWVDPTVPFAATVAERAHGVVITSATLTDHAGEAEADWLTAEARTGAAHLPLPAIRVRVPSPFDYPAQTRVLVVGDVRKDDLKQVAAAYRELFLASGGGALGLFTAIARLRVVHRLIAETLETEGLSLYAQHVDALNVTSLVDIFRAEADACLLGTDAVRDGVDVPGRSLRLIVFDRVPWPRPTILHRARRAAFGGNRYADTLTRLKLAQAYGRLIRRADDFGVFVLLDPMLPSRLTGAFPDGVAVERIGLAEAVARVRTFLGGDA